jgi:hypothetical protein
MADVLDHRPDLVGLQEWHPTRLGLLLETGPVRPVPSVGRRRRAATGGGYVWHLPLVGGCAVGARADRFELLGCRGRWLSAPGRAEREDHPLGLEPPRPATVAVYRDRHLGRTVALVDYHLAPGVQARGAYRTDRPRLVARHQQEVRRLGALVARLLDAGHLVHAVGDSNFDGLRLPRLTSAWEGREDAPGTLGPRRHVDDVHGPGRALEVTAITTASDHRALVVRRDVGRSLP